MIDLLNNPGGMLDGAVAAANWFTDDGECLICDRNSDKVEWFGAKAVATLPIGKPMNLRRSTAARRQRPKNAAGALKETRRANRWSVSCPVGEGLGLDYCSAGGAKRGVLRGSRPVNYITPSGPSSSSSSRHWTRCRTPQERPKL